MLKTVLSLILEFLYLAGVFVPGKLFHLNLANTLAYYKNLHITKKKSFITLAPGRSCRCRSGPARSGPRGLKFLIGMKLHKKEERILDTNGGKQLS